MHKFINHFARSFHKFSQMELKIVLKKFSDKFVQRRGFTTQQQQQQPQTSNVAQSSSKTTETPSPTTTTTTASNQNQTQTQAHSTSHTTSKTQTPTQPQSESLQSSNESKISPPNVTKRQVRQALLKGNRFTRLVSVGVVVSFAATTGYYLYDWHNTSATRYKQLRTMLRPESSTITKIHAFENLLAGVSIYKRTFSGRVTIPLDTPFEDLENGPASLFPFVLEAINSDNSRVRGLALSWLSHITATPHLHRALLQHPTTLRLLTQRIHTLPVDPMDTSFEHNREWILSAATLLHLLHSPHSEVKQLLTSNADVQQSIEKLVHSRLPLAVLFGSELSNALRGGQGGEERTTSAVSSSSSPSPPPPPPPPLHHSYSLSTRLVAVTIAEVQRSVSVSSTHLSIPRREVATELLVRSVQYLRAWYHHLFGSYDVDVVDSPTTITTSTPVPVSSGRASYILPPIQKESQRGIEGATLISVLGLGTFGWLWGRLGWWLRGGVKAVVSRTLTIRSVAPIVRSRYVGTYFTLLLLFDLVASHILRTASSRDLSFDFTRLATFYELFPSLVRFLNHHLGPNSTLFSSLNARFTTSPDKTEHPIPMVAIFPIIQNSLFTLGTLLLIRTQRFVVLPLLIALSWNQRDWLFGPLQEDKGKPSVALTDLSLHALWTRITRITKSIGQVTDRILSRRGTSTSTSSTSSSTSSSESKESQQ